MSLRRNTIASGTVGVLLVASGCGGGNDGPDRAMNNQPPGGGNELTVSTANAAEVSGEVVAATLGLLEFGDTFGTGPFAANNANEAAAQLAVVGNKTMGNLGKLYDPGAALSKTQISETVPCLVSGSVAISAELDDPNDVTPGDSYMSQFMACNDGGGIRVDGGLDFVITEFEGDVNALLFGGPFRLGTEVTATNLEITLDGITAITDGEFNIVLDTSNPPVTRQEFSGARFSTRESGGESIVLRNFAINATVDEGQFPELYTLDSRGTLESGTLGGTVTFSTVQPFQGLGDDYPFVGEQITTAADGTSVTLIALDSVNVRLEIDDDGDGVADQTTDTTWSMVTGD